MMQPRAKADLKAGLCRLPFYQRIQNGRRRAAARRWEQADCEGDPPHLVKEFALLECARRFGYRTLVETGTLFGDMLCAAAGTFDRMYSVELDDQLSGEARARFRRHRCVKILHGDSARVLPEVLKELEEPALFWLDGHYSGGITARGQRDTPIREEIGAILAHSVSGHTVLVDDADCFGEGDYPALDKIRDVVASADVPLTFSVRYNIICVCPAAPDDSVDDRGVDKAGGT